MREATLAEPGQRLLARIVDTLIVGVPVIVVVRAVVSGPTVDVVAPPALAGCMLLYEAIQLALWGRTFGKRVAGIEVAIAVPGAPLAPTSSGMDAEASSEPTSARSVAAAEGGTGTDAETDAEAFTETTIRAAAAPNPLQDPETSPAPDALPERGQGAGAASMEASEAGQPGPAVGLTSQGGPEQVRDGESAQMRDGGRGQTTGGEAWPMQAADIGAVPGPGPGVGSMSGDEPEHSQGLEAEPVLGADLRKGREGEAEPAPDSEPDGVLISEQARLDVVRAVVRAAVYSLPIAARPIPAAGLLAGIFWLVNAGALYEGTRRQAVHDRLIGTLVVKRPPPDSSAF